MWLLNFLIAGTMTPQAINGVFALVCLAAAFGGNARVIALVSAGLYVLLVLV